MKIIDKETGKIYEIPKDGLELLDEINSSREYREFREISYNGKWYLDYLTKDECEEYVEIPNRFTIIPDNCIARSEVVNVLKERTKYHFGNEETIVIDEIASSLGISDTELTIQK